MTLGTWYRRPGVLVLSLLIILFGWLCSKLFPHAAD